MKRRASKFSHVKWDEIITSERTNAAIAREVGCSTTLVRVHRQRLGIDDPPSVAIVKARVASTVAAASQAKPRTSTIFRVIFRVDGDIFDAVSGGYIAKIKERLAGLSEVVKIEITSLSPDPVADRVAEYMKGA